jgi:DNA mismatch repair ATPase MutS
MNILYRELKDRFCDCIMFFQLGDFLHAYGEDADIISEVCGVYCHNAGATDSSITVSHLTAHNTMRQLVKAGYKVAVANRDSAAYNLN